MNYFSELETAIAAARHAGELLRNELYAPEGPRGEGGHCPADSEAEEIIRKRLQASFPDYGVIGEELTHLNKPAQDKQSHYWIIDPNDGTSSFIKGTRGSSVSIALLRSGKPVLGVVYAFASFDGQGDLIAWAEGTGALTRNGIPLSRSPWSNSISSSGTILFNQTANRKSDIYTQLIAPARFRSFPSIAYRLALAAAGEGELAVSLHNTSVWDIAAGHALLAGAGGVLFNTKGEPVVYDAECKHFSSPVFGGAEAYARKLCSLDWSLADREPSISSLAPASKLQPWIIPVRGMICRDPDLLNRAQGCLLGQLAGDSLGSQVEFCTPDEIRMQFPQEVNQLSDTNPFEILAGQPTDDSELALILARVLTQTKIFDPEWVAREYCFWHQTNPVDEGNTIRQALDAGCAAIQQGLPVLTACHRAANTQSQANGALMRISPLGIWGHAFSESFLADLAYSEAQITHPNAVCLSANAVFVVAIAFAIRTGRSASDVYHHALEWAKKNAEASVINAIEAGSKTPPRDCVTQMGWVLLALQNAFYQLLHTDSAATAITRSVALGGDTDTNACIAGALSGAVHGEKSIPFQWFDRIVTCRPQDGLHDVKRPRPRPLWPIDAMALAERLLVTGIQCHN